MNDTLQAQLAALGNEVRTAAVPDGCKHTVAWCLKQLPTLYVKFHQTSESRYFEEITRLVQGVLKELTTNLRDCPEVQKLAAELTERLRLLHEEFGFPGLNLKPLSPSPLRSRKAG